MDPTDDSAASTDTDAATTTATSSLWLDAMPARSLPPLAGNTTVDVAVLGGGITGLTTALLLKRRGMRVAVLEARRCGAGVTGNSTAKATALQSTVYSTISQRHGSAAAESYGQASLAAVHTIAELAAAERIDCDLHRRPAYTYALTGDDLGSIQAEAEAAHRAGLPVRLTDRLDLPYPVAGAVCLDDQIEFHPVRYLRGLADAVHGDGSAVYEDTPATGVSFGTPAQVRTPCGTVRADHVVIATHYPLLDRGLFFARLEQTRSYCIAAQLSSPPPTGMSISAGSPVRSIRSHRGLLVLGGESHQAGDDTAASPERYRALEAFARAHWPVERITHRWSAQDPSSYDKLPVIGQYTPLSPRLFVASGFMKWGLTSGTFAATILADRITGQFNPWAQVFRPTRLSPGSLPDLLRANLKVAIDLVGDRVRPAQAKSVAEVPVGEARVVGDQRDKTGVYRSPEGTVHAVGLRCTHLGCLLRFNSAERSWDCPCHGSRFDVDGAVLEGPATRPLPTRLPE